MYTSLLDYLGDLSSAVKISKLCVFGSGLFFRFLSGKVPAGKFSFGIECVQNDLMSMIYVISVLPFFTQRGLSLNFSGQSNVNMIYVISDVPNASSLFPKG